MKDCVWCKKWNKPCGGKDLNCDFKSLNYTKEDILSRIKLESKNIEEIRSRVMNLRGRPTSAATNDFKEILDKTAGIAIMVNVLKKDFAMTDAQIKEYVAIPPMTSMEKLKLMRAAAKMKGGNNHAN
jgi:hypothetical protein